MEIRELYTRKGELVTQLEITQAQLQEVNKAIVEEINKANQPKIEEAKKE